MNEHEIPVVMEHAACPMGCAPADVPVLSGRDRLHDLPGVFHVVRCTHCQLMRTNPRPTAGTIGYYYPADYAPYHIPVSPRAHATAKPLSLARKLKYKIRQVFGQLEPKALPIEPPGRMLEVGSANGSYLSGALANGWQVKGIELSAEAAARAQAEGLDVECSTVEAMPPSTNPFDLIVGWMVFEHVHNPVATFSQLRQHVKPHGWLAFSVPDAGSLEFKLFGARWYALQLPAHMTHFTTHTAARALGKSGWKMSRVIWHKNPNNLLQSLRYWAVDRGHEKLAQYLSDLLAGKRGKKLHRRLGKWLAFFRQSGRMTIWAQRID